MEPTSNMPALGRRQLMTGAAALAAAAGLGQRASARPAFVRHTQEAVPATTQASGALALMDLPYESNALEPVVSANTISFHHDKHHRAYVNNTNAAVAGSALEGKPLEDIVRAAFDGSDAKSRSLFNNAAQVWNHDFYWRSMDPDGGGKPEGDLLAAIERDFGSFELMAESFAKVAGGHFASGWGWLVADEEGKLSVMSTGNADLPLVHGKRALLTIDVWEHAYYLDHQNRRADYIRQWMEQLANWRFAASNLAG